MLKLCQHAQTPLVLIDSVEWRQHALNCGGNTYPHNSKLTRRCLEIEEEFLYRQSAISFHCSSDDAFHCMSNVDRFYGYDGVLEINNAFFFQFTDFSSQNMVLDKI